jgi:hypothetical protein
MRELIRRGLAEKGSESGHSGGDVSEKYGVVHSPQMLQSVVARGIAIAGYRAQPISIGQHVAASLAGTGTYPDGHRPPR